MNMEKSRRDGLCRLWMTDDDSLDPDFPREPREGASFFELQQYLSSLTEYALDASIRARSKPKVVDADDDLPDKRHG
jgi:hypothetical protein